MTKQVENAIDVFPLNKWLHHAVLLRRLLNAAFWHRLHYLSSSKRHFLPKPELWGGTVELLLSMFSLLQLISVFNWIQMYPWNVFADGWQCFHVLKNSFTFVFAWSRAWNNLPINQPNILNTGSVKVSWNLAFSFHFPWSSWYSTCTLTSAVTSATSLASLSVDGTFYDCVRE